MEIEIECPICNDGKRHKAEILREFEGKYRRRYSEFEAKIYLVKCSDCKTLGIVRVVRDLNLELYEFPYESKVR